MRTARLALALICTGMAIGCGNNSNTSPSSPTAPSGTGEAGAAADGTTLKASAPVPFSPENGTRTETRRPSLFFRHSVGKFQAGSFTYRIELYDGTTAAGVFTLPQAIGDSSVYVIEADLNYDTVYRWRVRGELNGAFTAWSAFSEFRTQPAPIFPGGGATGTIDGTRTISLQEAFAIIVAVHDRERWNLGTASSREDRIRFLWRAVGIIHFGHAVYNPAGGDRDWCVKDAGNGRQPSDDVLTRCSTRESWDLIGSAGMDGYSFHLDYVGRLDAVQNVYPPPRPAGGAAALPAGEAGLPIN